MALFDEFPYLQDDFIVIRKMEEPDVDALLEITGNEKIYTYIPHFLFRKSRGSLLTAIRNLAGRDFDKKRYIMPGIYLRNEPGRLIGIAQVFDYRKRENGVTIGYIVNEAYWHRGVATHAVSLMKDYLLAGQGLSRLVAYVMPDNVRSAGVLQLNGFERLPEQAEKKDWAGMDSVMTDVYVCTNG
ncbi:MAG: GNAT family N-acetyltransferase [Clostridia bacterium]|nr:GNAT family N-acetyltransferase [Clostridia bacterium]